MSSFGGGSALFVRQQEHAYENTRSTNVGGDQDCYSVGGHFGVLLLHDIFAQCEADGDHRCGRIHYFVLLVSSSFPQPERFVDTGILPDGICVAMRQRPVSAFIFWRALSFGDFAA